MSETENQKVTKRRTSKPKTQQPKIEVGPAEIKPDYHAIKIPNALWCIMEKQGNDDFWIEEIKAILNRQYVKKAELGKRFYR